MKIYRLLIGALLVFFITSGVQAGVFNDIERGIKKFGRTVDPTNPNGAVGSDLHAKFQICNNTRVKVHYSVGEKNDALNAGYCTNWTTRGQGVVSFDRLFYKGYQRQTYTINDGRYYFSPVKWNDAIKGRDGNSVNGINLYKK